jgi:type IV secretory pathway VirB10-like protein
MVRLQECDRRCQFRQARTTRLRGDNGTAEQQHLTPERPSYQRDAMGLMPDDYYAAMTDSIITADLAQHYGVTPEMLRGDSGRNQPRPSAPASAAARPASPWVVAAGTLIPASLVTGINSDLCGDVKAVVTRDVYDARIQTVLIPAGTELLGTCDNQIATGQARLAIAWTHLRFPSGRGVALPGLPTHSGSGASGVRDRVNNHYARVFGTAVLLSALGAGAQLAIPQDSETSLSPAATAATAAAATLTELATEILRKNIEVKPTIEIRPATPFVVFVATDLDVGAPSGRRAGSW